jgi:diamine N-acetyltransferase
MDVRLVEVTRASVRAVSRLDAGDGGRHVAPNAVSIAEAHFCGQAWFRAIEAEGELAGFLMLYDPTLGTDPEEANFVVWRLMVDARFQNRGIGARAIELLVEHVRTRPGARELYLSHVPGNEAAARLYRRLGFRYTGAEDEGELVMVRGW